MAEDPIRVLIVDGDRQVCDLLCKSIASRGCDCRTAGGIDEAVAAMNSYVPAVLVADIPIDDAAGLGLISRARELNPACRIILTTADQACRNLAQALRLGAFDYFQKPLDVEELTESVAKASSGNPELHVLPFKAACAMEREGQFRQASLDSIRALVRAVEAKDPYTRQHSDHVAFYSVNLARQAGVSPELIETIRVAGLLHDLGMIGVPDEVLVKAGPLNEDEFEAVRRHPALGAHILEQIGIFGAEADLIRRHHERWDGLGYPDGLSGGDIPLGARIIFLADSIDAMLMPRSYRQCYPVGRMLDELGRCAGKQFDPMLAARAVQWWSLHSDELILPEGRGSADESASRPMHG